MQLIRMRVIIWWVIIMLLEEAVTSDPQTFLLNQVCSELNVTSYSDLTRNLNTTLAQLKGQLENNNSFAVAEEATGLDPVYSMVQCRNYISKNDCISCFSTASSQIRSCSLANGASIIYDGCFLRYESYMFYEQSRQVGSFGICGNQTASDQQTVFDTTVQRLLEDLIESTPRINSFFAASNKKAVGANGENVMVYGVAQCVETVDERGCKECLQLAYTNIQKCPPDSNGRAIDAGCFLRYSDSPFFAANNTIDLRPFLESKDSTKRKALIGGLVGGGGLLLLLSIFFVFWFKISKRSKPVPQDDDFEGLPEMQCPLSYTYKELSSATANFSEENKLGEGGYAEIFKGTLEGRIVAIKKKSISNCVMLGFQFDPGMKLLSNLHHQNVLRLNGYCSKGPDIFAVYEVMPNGSLDKHLFGQGRGSLNWKQRFDIILGIAKGLAYLHEDFHACIVHRDIKPSNILLDRDLQPKIADYGLMRILPKQHTLLNICKPIGTLGYIAPEYAVRGQLSEKVDIYSYGVLVLEILSGQKSTETSPDPTAEYLLKRAWGLYQNNMSMEIVDRSLDPNEYSVEDMKRIIEIAFLCTQSSALLRPTMSEVVALLKTVSSLQPRQPTGPGFIESERTIPEDRSIHVASHSTNSITQVSGR